MGRASVAGARLVRRFMVLVFRLLYGPLAWTYDAVAWTVSLGRWTSWGRVALPHLRGPAVLELGHGPGHLLVTMAGSALAPVGLDLSPQMGRLARRRLLKAGLPLRLVRARVQALPFRDGAFPSMVATFPTEYIVDPRTLREVRRVLQPGGRIVAVATAWLVGRDPPTRFLEWLYRVTGQRGPVPRPDDPAWMESGLALRTEWVRTDRSKVLLVMGERPPDG